MQCCGSRAFHLFQLFPKKSEIPFHSPNSENLHKSTWIQNLICMVRIAFDWATCTNHHTPILLKDVPGSLLSSVQCSKQQSLWCQVPLHRFGQYTPIPAMQKELGSNAKRIRHLPEKEVSNGCHMLSCSIKARTALQTNAESLNQVWVCSLLGRGVQSTSPSFTIFNQKMCEVSIAPSPFQIRPPVILSLWKFQVQHAERSQQFGDTECSMPWELVEV